MFGNYFILVVSVHKDEIAENDSQSSLLDMAIPQKNMQPFRETLTELEMFAKVGKLSVFELINCF